jgi:hypothetical protein
LVAARLRKVNGVPEHVLDAVWHRVNVAFARSDPFDWLSASALRLR